MQTLCEIQRQMLFWITRMHHTIQIQADLVIVCQKRSHPNHASFVCSVKSQSTGALSPLGAGISVTSHGGCQSENTPCQKSCFAHLIKYDKLEQTEWHGGRESRQTLTQQHKWILNRLARHWLDNNEFEQKLSFPTNCSLCQCLWLRLDRRPLVIIYWSKPRSPTTNSRGSSW